jgi:hypothetical protein
MLSCPRSWQQCPGRWSSRQRHPMGRIVNPDPSDLRIVSVLQPFAAVVMTVWHSAATSGQRARVPTPKINFRAILWGCLYWLPDHPFLAFGVGSSAARFGSLAATQIAHQECHSSPMNTSLQSSQTMPPGFFAGLSSRDI